MDEKQVTPAKSCDCRTFWIALLTSIIVVAIYHIGVTACKYFCPQDACYAAPQYMLVPVANIVPQHPGFPCGPRMDRPGKKFGKHGMRHSDHFGKRPGMCPEMGPCKPGMRPGMCPEMGPCKPGMRPGMCPEMGPCKPGMRPGMCPEMGPCKPGMCPGKPGKPGKEDLKKNVKKDVKPAPAAKAEAPKAK